ncbi:MAG: hypothetical protein AAFY20_21580 [Cyanobacteria bacterium J06639_14]
MLAFECHELEKILPEASFEAFIENFFQNKCVYIFSEIEPPSIEKSAADFGYWHSEICLVENNLANIIYWSHEGTVTLGGYKLINAFKLFCPDFRVAVCEWGYGYQLKAENSGGEKIQKSEARSQEDTGF